MSEVERIKEVYAKRDRTIIDDRYSMFNAANLFIIQSRERELVSILKKYVFSDLSDKKILDVGCGGGRVLSGFIGYGANPKNLSGIDLLPDRIELAKKLEPEANFQCGNAEKLPYSDESFDIVMQFTMFTSILDSQMKKKIAREMLRVLKPNGIILWYDYHMNNPKNPDVKGIRKGEIVNLFPNCFFDFRKITLAPPIVRMLAKYSWLLCYLLDMIPLLRTHYLVVIKKK